LLISKKNLKYYGAKEKEALYDLSIPSQAKHVIVFAHGYKGFKDWGSFPLWPEYFAAFGIAFLTFNFSHNGIGTSNEEVLDDEDGFAENRFSYELDDLSAITQLVKTDNRLHNLPITLFAHSRGGGVAQIFAAENACIHSLILMAAVSDFALRFPWDIDDWKREGVAFVSNARTGQKLPHKYSFYQDYLDNKLRSNLANARSKIDCSVFVAQGDSDPAVPVWEAETIATEINNSTLKIYSNTDHVFGARHPYLASELPVKVKELLTDVIRFLR
jgi:pimeloyl-ACP methyl ester carboxylesterase